MGAAKLLIPLALGAAAILGFTAIAKASPKGSAVTAKQMPPGLISKINAALESADPKTIRVAAAQVRGAGFPEQADSMLAAADDIQKAIKQAAIVSSGGIPQATGPIITTTGTTPPPTQPGDPARVLAGKVALMLTNSTKGSEDRELVRAYQLQEQARGQAVGAADGLYGVKTGITLARDHAIVPPKPFYYPKNPAPAKSIWRTEMLNIARVDTARAEEWTRAAAV